MMPLLLSLALAQDPSFVQLATGEDFTCGRTGDDRVLCWGNNEDHQLGVDTPSASAEPIPMGISNANTIAAGGAQACALSRNGRQTCWGRIASERWGVGVLPVEHRVFDAADVSVGPARGCTRHRGGGLTCWEPEGALPIDVSALAQIDRIAVGARHSCAIVTGGAVWCWADQGGIHLGGTQQAWPRAPVPVEGISSAIDIASGGDNTCAVLRGGGVRCWGPNQDGILGTGDTDPATGPREVKGLPPAAEVTVGLGFACARTASEQVWCWGMDPCPSAAAPSRRLAPVDLGIRGADALSDGAARHACALVSGAPVCWGNNSHGQALGAAQCVARPAESREQGPGKRLPTVRAQD